MIKRTILQNFEWYLPADGKHWQRSAEAAGDLAWLGFTDVWLPPAYKGAGGMADVGYGVYDLYDLGEFYQKGAVSTKYGTKDEYIKAIQALQNHGVRVIADIVLNHRMDADRSVELYGRNMEEEYRVKKIARIPARVWCRFDMNGRNGKYSNFFWDERHFSAYDWNEKTGSKVIFVPDGKKFSENVSREKDNYDYLMGANVDFSMPEVRNELIEWGKWYLSTAKFNGVRLDAVKHIDSTYFPEWLGAMRMHAKKVFEETIYKDEDMFAVGEYWKPDLGELQGYLEKCGGCMSLFDVPLQYRFEQAGKDYERFDLRTIFDGTLVSVDPDHAVTFVDNHDTQPHQALEHWVAPWFKPLAYALILLRDAGTPCVFFGDLYDIPRDGYHGVPELREMLVARRRFGRGMQRDYFDHKNVIGWTRDCGMAVVLSNGEDGWKDMELGKPGDRFYDITNHCGHEVEIGSNGFGRFSVRARSVSVWLPVKFKKNHNG